MPEATTKITIGVAKAFVQQALSRKPAWVKLSDEQFLGKMIAQGNYEGFFKTYQEYEEQLTEADRVYRETVRGIAVKVGAQIDPLPPKFRKKAPKPEVKVTEGAAEEPPGPAKPAGAQRL